MSGRGIRLPFDLLGVPVWLDLSFMLILPLFAYLIGSQITGYAVLLQSVGVPIDPTGLDDGLTPWLLGLAAAVGLFVSVLIHELGHAVVARFYGVATKEIRLWFLGGVAQFERMPRGRGAEAIVAIAGPLTSFAIGFLLWWALPLAANSDGLLLVVSYLAVTNVVLAIFNLLPALPLDGGRVLRGLLELFMPHLPATRVAAGVSAVVAILLGLYGFFSMNFLLVILAFFVYNAGRAEAQAAVVTDAFEGRSVADLMTLDPITVDVGMPLEQFVRLAEFRSHAGYPVVDPDGHLTGFASISDARAALGTGTEPDAEWEASLGGASTVGDILRPAETIAPDATSMEALRRLAEGELGRLMVVDGSGRLLGVIGKRDLIALLRSRQGEAEGELPVDEEP